MGKNFCAPLEQVNEVFSRAVNKHHQRRRTGKVVTLPCRIIKVGGFSNVPVDWQTRSAHMKVCLNFCYDHLGGRELTVVPRWTNTGSSRYHK